MQLAQQAQTGNARDSIQIWIENNAKMFHDYRNITTVIGGAISTDPGLEDLGPNNIDGTATGGILADNYIVLETPVPVLRDANNDSIHIGQSATLKSFFQTNFELHFVIAIDDGRIAASYNLLGVLNTTGGYLNVYVETDGSLDFAYGTNFTTTLFNWKSSTGVISNGDTGRLYIRARFDFTADTLSVWINQVAVAGAFNSSNISAMNPALWDTAREVYIGALNNAGTITTNANNVYWFCFGITPLDPPQFFMDYVNARSDDVLWKSQFHETALTFAATRTTLRTDIFGTYPTNAVPSAIDAIVSGTIHGVAVADIVGDASITRLTFLRNTNVSNKVYHIINSTPNGEIILYCLGHSPINDILSLNQFLANGYDILFCAMADSGDVEDLSDNTASTVWTPVSGGNHNEMASLNVPGLSYFFFDKIEAVNYIQANFSYTHIYAAGISGGGWTVCWLAALDERFEKTFPIRGVKPRIYKCPPVTQFWDYEQGGGNGLATGVGGAVYDFYTAHTYEDLIALGTTNGRLLKIITHTLDTAALGGNTFNTWAAHMQYRAVSLGGTYKLFLNTNGAEGAHLIYQDELDEILNEL